MHSTEKATFIRLAIRRSDEYAVFRRFGGIFIGPRFVRSQPHNEEAICTSSCLSFQSFSKSAASPLGLAEAGAFVISKRSSGTLLATDAAAVAGKVWRL